MKKVVRSPEAKALLMAAERDELPKVDNLDKDRLYMKLGEFGGIPEKVIDLLYGAGLVSVDLVDGASDDDLEAIPGIGMVRVGQIRDVLEG